jgi:hypothetical protein
LIFYCNKVILFDKNNPYVFIYIFYYPLCLIILIYDKKL